MPKRGLEPPQGNPYMALNHARLPVPPLGLALRAGTLVSLVPSSNSIPGILSG